ncbi:MAG: BrnT family toxin [Hyphomicrobiales bacterium]
MGWREGQLEPSHTWVSFTQAIAAFRDPFGVELLDDTHQEERTILLAIAGGSVLSVVYTEGLDRIRIISARRATRYEEDYYFQENAK